MAALTVLDGDGVARTLKVSTSGSDYVPHHNVDSISGVVAASQSGSWNVSITGTMPAISPGTGATNLGKAEDGAHTTGDVGVLALAVRANTAAAKTDADGDYHSLLVDSTGRLHASAIRNADGIGVGAAVVAVKRAFASIASATTDGSVVAAVTSKKLRVVGLVLIAGGTATTITLNTKPAGAGSAISATFSLAANGSLVLPTSEFGWCETNSGEGLSATTGAGSTVAIQVLYSEV